MNNANANNWMNQDQCISFARQLCMEHVLPVFVYQVAADRFNFRFISEEPSLGVLIARFDAFGRSF